jgi:beta-lactam-binding protein with PASTA domain
MLSGAPPFEGETPAEIARRHVEEPPPSLSAANPLIPARLDSIVRKALAKYPDDRFASAEEMADSLRSYQEFGEQRTGAIAMAAAGLPPPPARPQAATLEDAGERPPSGGVDWLFFLMGAVLVTLLVGLGVLGFAVYRSYSGEEATPTATAVPLVAVPGVESMDKGEAKALLEKQGFVYQELAAEFSDSVPVDTVIRQTPTKGTEATLGSTVSVVISRGPEKVRVPNVVGLRLDDAKLRLEQEGLKTSSVTESSSETAGIVIEQTPAPNTQVALGATVTLTVSKGPEPTVTATASNMAAMPDVVGLKEDKARERLADAGIVLHDYDVNYQGRGDLPDDVLELVCVGCVLSQTPAPGTPIPIGYDQAKIAVRRN